MSFLAQPPKSPAPKGPRAGAMQGERTRAPSPASDVIEKARDLKAVLSTLFPGREEQAEVIVLGLMTGLPVFLMSPPGTAKTKMIDTLAKSIHGANYFYYLLNRFTEPDELLGPVDIKALREGIYRRNTKGRLPEAHIVMLDEIFKASSAIRNVLLDIILNKRMPNGEGFIQLPMKALYTASNETPEDEEDWALYDRLVLRSFFSYAPDEALEEIILRGIKITVGAVKIREVMTLEEIDVLQQRTREYAISLANDNTIRKKIVEIVAGLRTEGIEYSDRRMVQSVIVLAALSLLRKRNNITKYDIADTFLLTAPQTPEHVANVEEVLKKLGLYVSKEVLEELDQLIKEAENLIEQFKKDNTLQSLGAASETIKKINELIKGAPRLPRDMIKRIKRLRMEFEAAKRQAERIFEG